MQRECPLLAKADAESPSHPLVDRPKPALSGQCGWEMAGAQIIDVASFMPERIVPVTPELTGDDSPFYRGVSERRFASPDYLSEDLGTLATKRLLERTATRPEDLDLILVSCIFTDSFW